MMIREYVTGIVNEKAGAENVKVNCSAVSFRGD
jgi:hypothetical protein